MNNNRAFLTFFLLSIRNPKTASLFILQADCFLKNWILYIIVRSLSEHAHAKHLTCGMPEWVYIIVRSLSGYTRPHHIARPGGRACITGYPDGYIQLLFCFRIICNNFLLNIARSLFISAERICITSASAGHGTKVCGISVKLG